MAHAGEARASAPWRQAELSLTAELRRLRKAAGLSQIELANRVGYSREYVSRAERGSKGLPSAGLIRALDAALNAEGSLIALHRLASAERQTQRNSVPSRASDRTTESSASGTMQAHAAVDVSISERAVELYVRAHGMLSSNDRRHIDDAIALLDQTLAIEPRFARARAARGYAEWRRYFAGWMSDASSLETALHDVDTALQLDPGSVGAHTTLIRICWDMGWHERGVEIGRRIFGQQRDSLDAALAYARAVHNAGMADVALPVTERVLAADPTHPTALKLLVWNCLMVGDHERAIRTGRRYLSTAPTDSNTRWAVAVAHLQNGSPRDAVRTVGDAVRADPDDLTVRALEGQILRAVGDGEAARAAWSSTLRSATTRLETAQGARSRLWLAVIQAALGRGEEALAAVADAVRAEPHNGYIRYRAAHVLAELGDPDDATASLRNAVAAGFLSVQLLHHDELLVLGGCLDRPGYSELVDTLWSNVERVRARYGDLGIPSQEG